jgi:peptidoglycan hydrolase-like protein with peptidoglycan-binding domain
VIIVSYQKEKHMKLVSRAAILLTAVLVLVAFSASPVVLAKDSKSLAKQTAAESKKKIDRPTITAVQKALVKAGYKIKIDGRYGRQVRSALKKYQRKNRLKITGRIDRATIEKMGIILSPDA